MDFTFKNINSGSLNQTLVSIHLDVKEEQGSLEHVTCSLNYCNPNTDYSYQSHDTVVVVSSQSITNAIEEAILNAVSSSSG